MVLNPKYVLCLECLSVTPSLFLSKILGCILNLELKTYHFGLLITLIEDLGLVPSTHMKAHSSLKL